MPSIEALRPRRALAITILVILLVAALPAWLFQNKTASYPATGQHRELRSFAEQVLSRTAPGDRVAMLVPPEDRESGTISFRIGYLLPQRHSVRVYDGAGRLEPAALQQADWIAAFRTPPPLPALRPQFQDSRGALWRVRP